ncbi:MAG TPA: hypothetical protein VGK89_10985 [Candidatus Eisenbacteria bacterium]|jgi:hypothetical protein
MKSILLTAALVLGALPPARAQDLGTLEGRWPAKDTDEIRLEFPVGTLEIESSDEPDIHAQLSVRCKHGGRSCYERSKQLRLVTHFAGGTRFLKLDGLPKFGSHGLEVTLRVAVPRTLAVEAEMGVGDCRVEGITRDLHVELGVGNVNVALKESEVRSVRLTVGVGDAKLRHGSQSQMVSGLLGRKVRWSEGTGASRVSVELGVGDIDVRLD